MFFSFICRHKVSLRNRKTIKDKIKTRLDVNVKRYCAYNVIFSIILWLAVKFSRVFSAWEIMTVLRLAIKFSAVFRLDIKNAVWQLAVAARGSSYKVLYKAVTIVHNFDIEIMEIEM